MLRCCAVLLLLVAGASETPSVPGSAGRAAADGPTTRIEPPAPSTGGPVAAQVRSLAGRLAVHTPEGRRAVTPEGPVAAVVGSAALDMPWGSEAVLSWPGHASLRVSGPARLEWFAPWSDGSRLTWRVRAAARLEAEVRQGPVELDLARGWSLVVGASAIGLVELAAGAVRVHHHAGTPLEVRRVTHRGARPTLRLRAGQSLRLKAGER